MPRLSAATIETTSSVLARYSFAPYAIHDIATGRMNKHWRIDAAGREYVLRRYNARRSATSIAWEHGLLAHAASQGLPVAPALAAGDGATHVELDGASYALFPFLPGRPAPYANLRWLRIKGRLLARLHHDLASWQHDGQREGYGRVWELDALFDGSPHRTFNDALRAFGREHRDLASGLRGQRYRSLRELSKLGYGGLPDIPVHWDFHHDNILTAGGEITGLLDFDSAHLDARVADIAFSISLDCREPPDHNAVNPAAVRAFVGGYVEHTPLSGQELRLLVPLMRAAYILGAALRLAYWEQFRADAARSIARSVRFRFPLHDERAAQLEAAVYDAATNNG